MENQIRQSVFQSQKTVIAAIFVASFFVNILALTAPIYMLQLFSRVMNSGSTSTLVVLTLGALIALGFFFLFDAMRQKLASRLGTRLEDSHGATVLDVLVQSASAENQVGAQPIRDLQEVRRFVTGPIFTAVLDAPWSLVFVAILFLFHPVLGWVAVVGLGALITLGMLSELSARKPHAELYTSNSAVHSIAEEMVRNADIVRAMGKTPALLDRWRARSNLALVSSTKVVDRLAVFSSAAKFTRLVLQIAVLAVGVSLVLRGELNPGVMIAASILLGRAAAPVEQSIAGWRSLLAANTARKRLNCLLTSIDAGKHRIELPAPVGRLDVENATVVVPRQQNPLIFDVNFALKPGDTMGIIGPSGSGKTTLVRSLVGLQPLSRGHIRVDDASLEDWPIEQIGHYVGFLPQRIELFDGTIAENIAAMDENATASDVVEAAKRAEVHDLILSLPGGYNAQVGQRGELLSAGQRQRIGLARAFFGEKRLIVLDEPNANLDPNGEEALARAVVNASTAGAVVIIVTHRMGILRRMSHAGLMVNGRMARFGAAQDVVSAANWAGTGTEQNPKVMPLRRGTAPQSPTPSLSQQGT